MEIMNLRKLLRKLKECFICYFSLVKRFLEMLDFVIHAGHFLLTFFFFVLYFFQFSLEDVRSTRSQVLIQRVIPVIGELGIANRSWSVWISSCLFLFSSLSASIFFARVSDGFFIAISMFFMAVLVSSIDYSSDEIYIAKKRTFGCKLRMGHLRSPDSPLIWDFRHFRQSHV